MLSATEPENSTGSCNKGECFTIFGIRIQTAAVLMGIYFFFLLTLVRQGGSTGCNIWAVQREADSDAAQAAAVQGCSIETAVRHLPGIPAQ